MFQYLRTSIFIVVAIAVICGLAFPLVITGVAQVAFPWQAAGSLVEGDGRVVGSELIGQPFTGPEYFHPRPSAAGSGYDAGSSGGTNLGPTNSKLINGIHKRAKTGDSHRFPPTGGLPPGHVAEIGGCPRFSLDADDDPGSFDGVGDLAAAYRIENGLGLVTPLPADAVTRSASGLDPHISLANADLQVGRVAKARGLSEDAVGRVVAECAEGRSLGVLGEPRVNVLRLNLALDRL